MKPRRIIACLVVVLAVSACQPAKPAAPAASAAPAAATEPAPAAAPLPSEPAALPEPAPDAAPATAPAAALPATPAASAAAPAPAPAPSPAKTASAAAPAVPAPEVPAPAAAAPAVPAPAAAAPAAASASAPAAPAAATPAAAAKTPAPAASAPSPALAAPAAPAPAAAARTAAGKSAPDRMGELVDLRGQVSVRRGDAELPAADVAIGLAIEPFDLMATGPQSAATVDLNAAFAGGATVRLSERTAFWFDLSDLSKDAGATDVRLLAGAVALKVQRLGAYGRVNVSTETTSFGVRGTEFIVSLAPEGSVLVTCLEGKVECADGDRTVYAQPGQAVERRTDGALAGKAVAAAELGGFRNAWLKERTDAFLADPGRYAAPYLKQAAVRGPQLEAAARGLRAQAAIWKKWADALAAGRTPSFVELGKDKPLVNPAMFAAAQALFFYEPIHYRLADMAARAPAAPALAAAAPSLAARETDLAYIRRIFALYGLVSDGSPLGEFFLERADAGGWSLAD